jgi:hypothetical protein
MLIPLIVLQLCPGQSSKCKNKQRAIIQNLGKTELRFLVLELCPGQCSKCKNKQRGIIRKLSKADLRFLYTAHLLNGIYLPTKFHVDTSCCFKVMSRTRKRDGRTDGSSNRRVIIWLLYCSFYCSF